MQAQVQQVPTPPTPPTAPTPPAGTRILSPVAGAGPADVYTAMREQRSEIRAQLERLEEKRSEIQRDMRQGDGDAADPGLLARLKELDARISVTDAQLAQADAAVAQAAAVPGAVIPEPEREQKTDPTEMLGIGGSMLLVLLFPIVVAYARRIWRRGATIIAPVPQEVRNQLDQLSHAVESIGLEVERIGEGQRFITKVFGEQGGRAIGAGAADHVPVAQRDREQVR